MHVSVKEIFRTRIQTYEFGCSLSLMIHSAASLACSYSIICHTITASKCRAARSSRGAHFAVRAAGVTAMAAIAAAAVEASVLLSGAAFEIK